MLSQIPSIMNFPKTLAKTAFIFIFLLGLSNASSAKCVYAKPLKIRAMEMGNMLAWSTAEEEDLQIFVIEKSKNGIDFKRVGDVEGSGYSTKRQSYRFLDFGKPGKKTYYRLLHYAKDGSFTISETFFIGQDSKNEFLVTSVSSTLTNDQLDLTVKSRKDQNINIEVRTRSGEVVKTVSQKITSGNNTLSINCDAFANGKYDIILTTVKAKTNITIKKVSAHEMPPLEYAVINR